VIGTGNAAGAGGFKGAGCTEFFGCSETLGLLLSTSFFISAGFWISCAVEWMTGLKKKNRKTLNMDLIVGGIDFIPGTFRKTIQDGIANTFYGRVISRLVLTVINLQGIASNKRTVFRSFKG
jgi:hypothetical protein